MSNDPDQSATTALKELGFQPGEVLVGLDGFQKAVTNIVIAVDGMNDSEWISASCASIYLGVSTRTLNDDNKKPVPHVPPSKRRLQLRKGSIPRVLMVNVGAIKKWKIKRTEEKKSGRNVSPDAPARQGGKTLRSGTLLSEADVIAIAHDLIRSPNKFVGVDFSFIRPDAIRAFLRAGGDIEPVSASKALRSKDWIDAQSRKRVANGLSQFLLRKADFLKEESNRVLMAQSEAESMELNALTAQAEPTKPRGLGRRL